MPDMHVIDLAAALASGSGFTSETLAATLAAVVAVLTLGFGTLTLRRLRIETQRNAEHLTKSMRELEYNQERLSREQASHISVNVERLAEDLQITPRGELIIGRSAGRETEQLIREISHSLNTPLGQIELTIARLAEIAEKGSASLSLRDAATRARQNIQTCRAVLAAYKELTSVSAVASQWDVDDLRSTLRAITETFISQEGKPIDDIQEDALLPRSVVGYSNYFILSLLLPLVQNAVEAAPPNTAIECWLEQGDNYYRFHVGNVADPMPDLELLSAEGYTTKGEGHEGLGLSSVRTLLARQAHLGARLEFARAPGNLFTAIVHLPRLESIGHD